MRREASNPKIPSAQDIALAQVSSRVLANHSGKKFTISIAAGKRTESVDLPKSAVEMLVGILAQMAEGNAVTVVPTHAFLTTRQAADILGVSRPFVTQQLKDGRIRFQKIGTHRRILFTDLLKYQRQMTEESDEAMDELVSQAQQLGMGY